jgi:SAM-dependent methyltransferase
MDTETYNKIHAAEDSLWFYLGRRAIVRRLIEAHSPAPARRALDVGCGSGGTLATLGAGAQFSAGLDSSLHALRLSRERGLPRLFQCDAQRLALAVAGFDLVTALDVIEHCRDDVQALREIWRVLAPGGLCVLTVPALMILWSNLDRVSQHFRRYTAGQLRARAEQAGFEILRVSYANTWLFPGILAARLLQRVTQRPGGGAAALDFAMPSRPLNALLTRIFASEAGWLARASLPVGSSVVAALRKPGGAA